MIIAKGFEFTKESRCSRNEKCPFQNGVRLDHSLHYDFSIFHDFPGSRKIQVGKSGAVKRGGAGAYPFAAEGGASPLTPKAALAL